jgi:hypothetical protein
MELTETQFNNFAYKVQCCLADKADALRYNLRVGNATPEDINLFIFATIYNKILTRLGFNQTCLEESAFCKVIQYLRWYCKECAC